MRNQTIEMGKFLAAWGVIIIHVSPGTDLARSVTSIFTTTAVPFFLITSLFFTLQKTTATFQDLPYRRLLLPYVCWSLVYLALRFAKYRIFNENEDFDWLYILFFGGASTGLYFLPLLLGFQLVGLSLSKVFGSTDRKSSLINACIVLSGLFCLSEWIAPKGYLGFRSFFENALIYSIVAMGLIQISKRFQRSWMTLGLCAAIGILAFLSSYSGMAFNQWTTPLAVACMLYACLHFQNFSPRKRFVALFGTSYGIYLSHQLFDRFLEVILPRFGIGDPAYSLTEKIVVSTFILTCSVATVFIIRRFGILRYCFLGENLIKRQLS